MKTQAVLVAALAAAPSALAHTVWTNFYVDGTSQGDGVAVRMRKDPAKASFPIESYGSDDMACNVDGTTGVSRVQSVKDGSTLTFETRSWPDDPSKPALDPGHKGPCAFYMKKVSSAVDDKGTGNGWFKLYDQGYDANSDSWCTDTLIANKGRISIKIPQNLAGGYYLARPEILALHNATNGDGQFYTGCGQIFVDSKGDLGPESTVSIPGYVKAGDPSVMFNIYNNKNTDYKVPGPAVAKLVSGGSAKAGASSGQATQTEGLRPAGCILENANWCGKEVASYTDEKGCWASGEDCWTQAKACWASAPPTGGKGCEIWQDKCTNINDNCKAKNFNGPPNKDKDLTPDKTKIDVGSVQGSALEVVGGNAAAPVSSSEAPKATSAAAESKPASSIAAVEVEPTSSAAAEPSSQAPSSQVAAPSPSSSVAEQPKPSATEKPNSKGHTKPTFTVTQGPQATPAACPRGYKCVTQLHTEVEVVTKYQTVEVEVKRRAGVHARRHRQL
ncbi:hypothetical protein P280DRAFT_513266 [Massarina eburnea CBS 473.64]|uniref:AA9 family lytic polysaccharide monooxygenase n=1 Tax=Massarina eburnea CBS 473.64 TaxID=1395130 RepID=A0A6A6SBW8_9PLEO|nr:hypothetical protein P280DRAFT_513266 [Massarina eburnea CBS 473.64]